MTSFSATPEGTTAGSNQNIDIDAKFDANPTSMTLNFPPGLWASIAGGPNVSIASGSISLTAAGLVPLTATANMYPSTAAAPAGAPPACSSPGSPSVCTLSTLNLQVVQSSFGITLNVPAYAVLHAASEPSLQVVVPSIPNNADGIPITISEIQLKMLGSAGARLPSSNNTATISATSAPAGSGSSTFTPTATTAYSPSLFSATAALNMAEADQNSATPADVILDIQQPSGQAGTNAEDLVIPHSVLQVSGDAIADLVNQPDGTQVGTVTLDTPLLPKGDARTNGTFTLSGSPDAPVVKIAFPGLGGLSFSGTIDPATIGGGDGVTVHFTDIPDVPFTDLNVNLPGGNSKGLFNLACDSTNVGSTLSGQASSTFTSWWPGLTAGPSKPTITANAACPATSSTGGGGSGNSGPGTESTGPGPAPTPTPASSTPPATSSSPGTPAASTPSTPTTTTAPAPGKPATKPKVGPPTLSKLTLTGLAKGKPRLAFRVTQGKNADELSAFSINIPGALSYVTKNFKKDLAFHGAKVKSAKVIHGKLVVELKARAKSVGIVIGIGSQKETKQLQTSVRKHKAKSLNFRVQVRAAKTLTTLSSKITKFS